MKKENILKDFKHWIGWVLSAIGILLIVKLVSTNFFIILITIIAIDYFKHKWRLQ